MHEMAHIEQRAAVLHQAKTEMACKIAQLNELMVKGRDLESRLFELNANVKQLKARQCELHQMNVDAKCKKINSSKAQEQFLEEIRLGTSVTQAIQMDVMQQKDKNEEILTLKQNLSKRKECLQAQICKKNAQIQLMRRQIVEMQKKGEGLQKVRWSKQDLVEKLRQSYSYYVQKVKQLEKDKQNIKKLCIEQHNRNQQLTNSINQNELKKQDMQIQKIEYQRQVQLECQKIESQQLKNKVLIEKLQIMRNRLAQVQEQKLYSKQILQIKRNQFHKTKYHRKSKLQAWKSIRDRINIQLEYTNYFSQRLGY